MNVIRATVREQQVHFSLSVPSHNLSSATLATLAPKLPSPVAKRRVASLRHVVGVWPAAGGKLPGTNGGRGSRGGSGAQIQHGLLGEALTFRAGAALHLRDKASANGMKIKRKGGGSKVCMENE